MRTRPLRTVVLLLLAVLALGSCAQDSGDTVTPTLDQLAGKTWTTDHIENPLRQLVDGTTVSLTFTTNSLSANAGCNTLAGKASIDAGRLTAGPFASTLKACDQALMEQDVWLGSFLESGPTIAMHGDELWLSQGNTTMRLTAA